MDGGGVALAGGVWVALGSRAMIVGVCVVVGVLVGRTRGVWLGVRVGAMVGVACGMVRLHAVMKSALNARPKVALRRIILPPVRWK